MENIKELRSLKVHLRQLLGIFHDETKSEGNKEKVKKII
jgi:hypothetical protein